MKIIFVTLGGNEGYLAILSVSLSLVVRWGVVKIKRKIFWGINYETCGGDLEGSLKDNSGVSWLIKEFSKEIFVML